MKKLILFGSLITMLLGTTVYGQSSTATTNSTGGTQFLGFNGGGGGGPKILEVRNNFNLPIEFYTNNFQRMRIENGAFGPTNGRIGMGNNLSGFTPQARLHLHETFNSRVTLKFTNSNTTAGGANGFDLGYHQAGYAEVNNRENSTMRLFTNSSLRMLINPDQTNQIGNSPYTVPSDGFVAIGGHLQPFSMLHLDRPVASGIDDFGYPPWMRGGVTFTDNVDLAYVGIRPFFDNSGVYDDPNVIVNRNEFVIAWSNNEAPGVIGADDMAFRFTTGTSGSAHSIDMTDFTTAEDLDGRHIVRFTALGNMGLGPTFGEELPGYTVPQSLAHLSRDKDKDVYLQITNRTGTGETATDGLRIGITGNGTAHIRQQQDLPMIFYTNKLETARMVPGFSTTFPSPNSGMMGLGDFTTVINLANPIDAKLDIDGDLRIRQVTQDNTLTQVLAINPGDNNRVHWVDASNLGGAVTADNGLSIDPLNPGEVEFGQDVGAAGNPAELDNDREIPMNDNNIEFNGVGTIGKNQIIIGQANPFPETIKVYAHNTVNNVSVGGVTDGTIGPQNQRIFGVAGVVINATSDQVAGVFGGAQNTQNGLPGRGVWGRAANNDLNYGVQGDARTSGAIENRGGTFEAHFAGTNYGVYATATGGTTNYAGFFDGDVFVTGDVITQAGNVLVSDNMFKQNQLAITNANSIISQLQPKTYNLDSASFPQFGFGTQLQMGLVAQEVAQVLPNLVSDNILPAQYDTSGNQVSAAVNYKGLNYQQFIPLLIAGMQEQQSELDSKDSLINDLKDRMDAMEWCLNENNLCNNGEARTAGSNEEDEEGRVVQLNNLNAIILDQNLPNPFKEKTTINYSIPEEVMEAQLLFYDMNGRIIKQVDIEEKGEGKLTVFGENLQNGIYTYSLIADGKLIATKKMVKQ